MPKGRQKKTHKGGHRHFTSQDQLAAEKQREERQKEWRRQKGLPSESEESEEEEAAAPVAKGAPGDLPPSESSSEEESEEDEDSKAKGVSHLIETENPNHIRKTTKKVSELGEGKTELSRKEREELEKQQAKVNYQKMHLAGKTDEARADLARLALIRKQREDAARKKEEEAKARDETKNAAEKKLLEKRKAAKQ